ncbi:MAG TPA: hypothetical protein PKK06_00700 [Phycisphaerae bacterium]|nr:hypothetical protein [Phycisphaerae bacterium]HNU43872.1 hypothetical protein [Phycisphaerae bacterium]
MPSGPPASVQHVRTSPRHHWLAGRSTYLFAVLLGCGLGAPSLWFGWLGDDHGHRAALIGLPQVEGFERSFVELYNFQDGDPSAVRRDIEIGLLPWWSYERLRLAFLRPVTGLTLWLDYHAWPEWPVLMHAQSLLWYAGVVLAATCLYRRLHGPTWTAGLAALLFAVDDAHAMPATWMAGRNAAVAMFFGLLAILAYDRWRREGWRWGAVWAPLCLLAAVLSAEMAVATGGYLVAYVVFVDRGAWARRLLSLLPCVAVGVGWSVVCHLTGHGVAGSEVYIDPVQDPLRYAHALVERIPLLIWGQWGLSACDLQILLSAAGRRVFWWVCVGLVALLAVVLTPLIRHDRTARFWLLGSVLAMLPVGATYPTDRLLMFVSLGGMAVLAQYLAGVRTLAPGAMPSPAAGGSGHASRALDPAHPRPLSRVSRAPWLPRTRWGKRGRLVLCVLFVLVHFVMSPVNFVLAPFYLAAFDRVVARAGATLPADEQVTQQSVFVMQTPCSLFTRFAPVFQALNGRPLPARTLVLSSGVCGAEVYRPDEHTLVVRPGGGLYPAPGTIPQSDGRPPALLNVGYAAQLLDRLFRDDGHPLQLGQRIALREVTIEITAATADQRPAEITFHFRQPLESPAYRWVHWQGGVYVPFSLPAVGETITLPTIKLGPGSDATSDP